MDDCGICDGIKSIAKKLQQAAFAQQNADSIDAYKPYPPPLTADELGRQTWAFLHTMAAYYPENPTAQQQRQVSFLFNALASLYPCHVCAEHLSDELQVHPPRVESGNSLSQWLCEVHNEVNERLGKPVFDCSKVLERWKIRMMSISSKNQDHPKPAGHK
jgi:FAD-linked sulfhydryl oxidase